MTDMAYLSLALAVANFALWVGLAFLSVRDWRRFHDERAARGVLLSLVLVAAGVGSITSASGLLVIATNHIELAPPIAFASAVARTAMLVGTLAYIASRRRRDP